MMEWIKFSGFCILDLDCLFSSFLCQNLNLGEVFLGSWGRGLFSQVQFSFFFPFFCFSFFFFLLPLAVLLPTVKEPIEPHQELLLIVYLEHTDLTHLLLTRFHPKNPRKPIPQTLSLLTSYSSLRQNHILYSCCLYFKTPKPSTSTPGGNPQTLNASIPTT